MILKINMWIAVHTLTGMERQKQGEQGTVKTKNLRPEMTLLLFQFPQNSSNLCDTNNNMGSQSFRSWDIK